MTTNAFVELRNSLQNVYAVTHNGDLLHIKDLSIHPMSIVHGEHAETETGYLLRQSSTGAWEDFEIPSDVKDTLTNDPEIVAYLDNLIKEYATGKTYMTVGIWAMKFNEFSFSFTNRTLEV